jgi:signal recognition particle subunit SRP54
MSQPGLMQKMLGYLPGMGDMQKMLEGEDTEGSMRQTVGIIDSMTPAERRNPKLIDPSRRQRIARGAGVQPQEVNQLIKMYEKMAPVIQSLAGKGIAGRMQAIRQMQQSGMLDPGAAGPRVKKGTGKRLSPKERARMKKQRDKELRRRRRQTKG